MLYPAQATTFPRMARVLVKFNLEIPVEEEPRGNEQEETRKQGSRRRNNKKNKE